VRKSFLFVNEAEIIYRISIEIAVEIAVESVGEAISIYLLHDHHHLSLLCIVILEALSFGYILLCFGGYEIETADGVVFFPPAQVSNKFFSYPAVKLHH